MNQEEFARIKEAEAGRGAFGWSAEAIQRLLGAVVDLPCIKEAEAERAAQEA